MRNFSCSFARLYATGGFYEGEAVRDALVDVGDACRWQANLYPPYAYERPLPEIHTPDAALRERLHTEFRTWDAGYPRGASSDLFLLERGLLFDRCLYQTFGDEIVQMYEFNKPNDRRWRPDLDPAADLREIRQPHDPGRDFLYLGSIGSQNYGHWLVDDVTRARTLLRHFERDRLPAVVLNAFNPVIDGMREQTLRALVDGADLDVHFVSHRAAHYFPRLYVVSPCTLHAFLKSPDGIAFLREHFVERALRAAPTRPAGGTRLFVTRRALWRNLLNADEVAAYFRDLAFEVVATEELTFVEQIRLFARAEVIVGVMGAALTNIVFSPPGATVVALAPSGWSDSFFWDLAAIERCRYSLVYGPTVVVPGERWDPAQPALASFRIDLADLEPVRRWIAAA